MKEKSSFSCEKQTCEALLTLNLQMDVTNGTGGLQDSHLTLAPPPRGLGFGGSWYSRLRAWELSHAQVDAVEGASEHERHTRPPP